jgi:hypothetical protein
VGCARAEAPSPARPFVRSSRPPAAPLTAGGGVGGGSPGLPKRTAVREKGLLGAHPFRPWIRLGAGGRQTGEARQGAMRIFLRGMRHASAACRRRSGASSQQHPPRDQVIRREPRGGKKAVISRAGWAAAGRSSTTSLLLVPRNGGRPLSQTAGEGWWPKVWCALEGTADTHPKCIPSPVCGEGGEEEPGEGPGGRGSLPSSSRGSAGRGEGWERPYPLPLVGGAGWALSRGVGRQRMAASTESMAAGLFSSPVRE